MILIIPIKWCKLYQLDNLSRRLIININNLILMNSSAGSSFLFVDAPGKPRVRYIDPNSFEYKIVVVGPSESGKTSMIQKYLMFDN